MKTLITTLLVFLSGSVGADTIVYKCGKSYQSAPCQGEITTILIYTSMTQRQKDHEKYARLEQDLKDTGENTRLETVAWQQLELQRQIETAKQAYLNDKLITLQRITNYRRAEAIMQFKHGRENEIHQYIKDQDNEMLDDIAWQSIQMGDDIVWHQSGIK